MGKWDRENYLAVIKVRDNITDPIYMDYCIRTDMGFSLKEYLAFEAEHPTSTHPVAVKALDFICQYKEGKLKPDKWGYGDPLKRPFDKNAHQMLASLLTRPGGSEDIRKNRFFSAELVNEMYVPMWEGRIPFKMSERTRILPEYMFSMTFYFSKSLKDIYPFIEEFVKDFCDALSTDYGKIIDQSTMETIFDISSMQ